MVVLKSCSVFWEGGRRKCKLEDDAVENRRVHVRTAAVECMLISQCDVFTATSGRRV